MPASVFFRCILQWQALDSSSVDACFLARLSAAMARVLLVCCVSVMNFLWILNLICCCLALFLIILFLWGAVHKSDNEMLAYWQNTIYSAHVVGLELSPSQQADTESLFHFACLTHSFFHTRQACFIVADSALRPRATLVRCRIVEHRMHRCPRSDHHHHCHHRVSRRLPPIRLVRTCGVSLRNIGIGAF